MVYISKTLIPGKTPIGSATGGGYMYDDKDRPASTFSSTQNMSVPGQNMSFTPKQQPVSPFIQSIGKIPGVGDTPITPFAPSVGFSPERAKQINAPVQDTLNFRAKINEADDRVKKLREHFRSLEQKGNFQLNKKQSDYIKKFKVKHPSYANVPDVSLYSKIILAEPKAMEQYGNIGEKGFLQNFAETPFNIAKSGAETVQRYADRYSQDVVKGGGGAFDTLAAIGGATGGVVMDVVGNTLNIASPLLKRDNSRFATSITEGLGADVKAAIPETVLTTIDDLSKRYPTIAEYVEKGLDISNLIPFLGALGKAKSAGQVDDILRTVKARPATRFRGEVSPTAFEAGMNRSLISDVAQIPVKTTKATLKGTAKAGEFTGETAIATGVGISKPSQQAIKEAPELYKQARTGALTRETATEEVVSTLKKRLGELSDTGKEYNTIRQSPVTMPKQDFGKILDDFFKENDISKIDMPVKDRKVVQQAIDYIAEYDDVLSAKNGLSLRRKLDDLDDWSTDATGEGKRLIRKLRGKVDEYLGGKIPGLKELDAKYAPEVSFLKKVKSGILNADGSIKDSAISYVANIVGKGKEMKLDRLEELLPGIGQKVRALKAFEEVQAISSMKTGSIMRQLSGVALGNTVVPGFGAIAGFIATNPNIVAFALEKYGMAKKAIQALLKKGAKITPDEAVKVKQAVDAVPSNEVSTFLLGAGEQRKLLMPPKQGDNIIKQLGGGDTPTPSSSLPSRTSEASSIQKLLQEPQKPQQTPGKSSVLSQLSKGKEKSASNKVNNPIIQKLKEKKNNIVEGLKKAKVDTELESLQKIQESMPGVPSIEVPKDYTPTGGLPTGTEVEAPIISSISKTKGKLPSPEIKRPQIRGFDLSTRSSMLESLKEQGMFTDSFFVVKDKNVSNKLFEYAEKKAIKKGNPTSGTKVDMKALVERAENGADTLLTPKEYMKLGKENGVYLRMDIGNGNQVAVNASYADIFFKNFDDVTFKGNNELSPVVVLSKGEPVGVIMPIKDVYSLKGKLGDFSMQSKTPQVEGKTVPKEILDEMNNYDNAHDFAMNAMIGPGGKVYKIGDNVKVETMAGTVDGKITKNIGKTNIVDEGKPKSSGYIQDSPNGHPVQVTLKDGTKIDTNLGLIDQDSTGDYIFGKKQSDKLRELFESKAKPKPSLTLSQKSEGKTLKDNLEWTPSSKLDQDIFYVDRNGIRQTEFESAGKNIKGQRAGYTMEEYLNKNGLSKDDFTLSKGTDGADGLYVLNEKGLSKLEKLRAGNKPKPSLPLSSKSEVKYSDTLESEAKNYKSADDFIKAQEGSMYFHGTNVDFKKPDVSKVGTGEGSIMAGKGFNLTSLSSDAKNYAYQVSQKKGGKEVILGTKIDKNKMNLFDADKMDKDVKMQSEIIDFILKKQNEFKGLTKDKIIGKLDDKWTGDFMGLIEEEYGFAKYVDDFIKSKGFDGVITKERTSQKWGKIRPENITIFNPKDIEMVNLIDIYNKANKK